MSYHLWGTLAGAGTGGVGGGVGGVYCAGWFVTWKIHAQGRKMEDCSRCISSFFQSLTISLQLKQVTESVRLLLWWNPADAMAKGRGFMSSGQVWNEWKRSSHVVMYVSLFQLQLGAALVYSVIGSDCSFHPSMTTLQLKHETASVGIDKSQHLPWRWDEVDPHEANW